MAAAGPRRARTHGRRPLLNIFGHGRAAVHRCCLQQSQPQRQQRQGRGGAQGQKGHSCTCVPLKGTPRGARFRAAAAAHLQRRAQRSRLWLGGEPEGQLECVSQDAPPQPVVAAAAHHSQLAAGVRAGRMCFEQRKGALTCTGCLGGAAPFRFPPYHSTGISEGCHPRGGQAIVLQAPHARQQREGRPLHGCPVQQAGAEQAGAQACAAGAALGAWI